MFLNAILFSKIVGYNSDILYETMTKYNDHLFNIMDAEGLGL